jgi:hypothetical protein
MHTTPLRTFAGPAAGYPRYQQRTERELPIVVLEGGRQQR